MRRDCEESWVPKNWRLWIVVLEKTPESPLDCKEIQPVHSKGDQSWVFFGGNDAKAETPVLWPPHAKSWLTGKDSDAGRDWGQEEKGTTEDEMAGWHHWLDGREFEWTPGVVDGQGGLACCNSWGCKESDMTERLNWTELTETGKGVNGTSEFLLQFFPHCVNSHSSADAAPWVYPRGSRQDSGRTLKHWITQRECYSISKSSLVLPISLKKKVSGGSTPPAPL